MYLKQNNMGFLLNISSPSKLTWFFYYIPFAVITLPSYFVYVRHVYCTHFVGTLINKRFWHTNDPSTCNLSKVFQVQSKLSYRLYNVPKIHLSHAFSPISPFPYNLSLDSTKLLHEDVIETASNLQKQQPEAKIVRFVYHLSPLLFFRSNHY